MTITGPLANELLRLRKAAGLSQTDAAKAAHTTQPTVLRAETGQTVPRADLVKALCRAYGAPAELRAKLLAMAEEGRAQNMTARTVIQQGGWRMQEKVGLVEQSAARIVNYSPTGIIGLLQTADYIRAMFAATFTADDLERSVVARLERQSLLDSEREFVFVQTEGALRWNFGPPVMAAQMDHLAEVAARPNVALGVIPQATVTPVPAAEAWSLHDRRTVIVGTRSGVAFITSTDAIGDYERHLAMLEPYVAWGDDALTVIRRVQADFAALA